MPPNTAPRFPQLSGWLLAALLAALLAGCGGGGGDGQQSRSTHRSRSASPVASRAAWHGPHILAGGLTRIHAGGSAAGIGTATDKAEPMMLLIDHAGEINGLWSADSDRPPVLIKGTISTSAAPTIAILHGFDNGSVKGTVTLTPSAPGSTDHFTARIDFRASPGADTEVWQGDIDTRLHGVVLTGDTRIRLYDGSVSSDASHWRPGHMRLRKDADGKWLLQGYKRKRRITVVLAPSDIAGAYQVTAQVEPSTSGKSASPKGPTFHGLCVFYAGSDPAEPTQLLLTGHSGESFLWLAGEFESHAAGRGTDPDHADGDASDSSERQ